MENEECPTNDFVLGDPSGKCWGDGHFRCKECVYYREDFKRLGQDYVDSVHHVWITFDDINEIAKVLKNKRSGWAL